MLAQARGARLVRTRTEIHEQTEIGDALVRGLVRAQLGLALRLGGLVGVICVSIPLLAVLFPVLGQWDVGGVRVYWLILGPGMFAFLYLVGRLYVRLAANAERDFLRVVERDDGGAQAR